jgi:hypothetical protein
MKVKNLKTKHNLISNNKYSNSLNQAIKTKIIIQIKTI